MNFPNLDRMIQPREIAIIGASERAGSHARTTYENITRYSNFDREKVYLVNPKYDRLFDQKCYKSVKDIPSDRIDVVIIVVRADLAVQAVKESDECNIPFALVMSSGFAEVGEKGKEVQAQLEEVVKNGNIRVYGPNCPGLVDINRRLGMTFSPAYKHDTLSGGIGLIAQGGGVGRSLLQGMKRGIGFGYFISLGNEIDLDITDFIFHMLEDPKIKVIMIVAEGIKDGEKFKEVANYALKKEKPIVILKVGRTAEGQKAVLSHTGKLAGSDQVFDALCEQYGIIRVNDVDELLETSALFARCGVRKENGIVIITGSGGSGAHLADQIGYAGLELAELSSQTVEKLKEITPPFASLKNPVDLTATALEDEELHAGCFEVIARDQNAHIIIEPIASSYGEKTEKRARELVEMQKNTDAILIVTWMSSMEEGGYHTLVEGGLVPFRSVRNTVNALKHYIHYGDHLKRRKERNVKKHFETYDTVIPNNTILNEVDSKEILRKIGIEFPKEKFVTSYAEAMHCVDSVGYPLVLKCVSRDIPHKTEAGAVKLNIQNEHELKEAFSEIEQSVQNYNPDATIEGYLMAEMITDGLEMIVGIKSDPQFGQTILVGMGGIYTEIFKDVSMGICPVDKDYALAMISKLKTSLLLEGYRGSSKRDITSLALTIEKLSQFAFQMKDRIQEIDLNPLMVFEEGQGVKAVDALIVSGDLNSRDLVNEQYF